MVIKANGTKPHIAIFSGPTATIQNSEPLVTSNQARAKHGLPLRTLPDGSPLPYDVVRPQRLAAPVKIFIEAFSGHPLERDAAELYAEPDGYIGPDGVFHTERQGASDVPVYEAELKPEDGLFFLPYMARQANGQPWEDDCAYPLAPAEHARQCFYPDASRIFEEIDRFGVGDAGLNNLLAAQASFDFYRAAPSGGYKKGLPETLRTDAGSGDIPAEIIGEDFFGYRPRHLSQDPPMQTLARLTNVVQRAMASGQYAGGVWLEGSPTVEETTYWLGLLIDTTAPLVGNASQRAHGAVANDGDRNLIDSANYICSRIWADETGVDIIGAVVIQDEQVFTARDVQKADARPGGYTATGGHGGVIASMGAPGPAVLTFKTVKHHTYCSQVNTTRLPDSVEGVQCANGSVALVPVQIKDAEGDLTSGSIPKVTIVKYSRYLLDNASDDPDFEVEIGARVKQNLSHFPLSGFVLEGSAPFASANDAMKAALGLAALQGMPVVRVGRGNAEGMVPPDPSDLLIDGSNLTATKARLLLMACLMKFGCLPPAVDPKAPTPEELDAARAKIAQYQTVFDTH